MRLAARALPHTRDACLRRFCLGSLCLFARTRVRAYAARALPLCGAAVTFFVPQGDFLRGASAKKVTKESGLTPPILDRYPRAPNVPILRTATNRSMSV